MVATTKKPTVTIQIDKSTCLSYNLRENAFGYRGVPTNAFKELLREIEFAYAVNLDVQIQPTHTFDFNAQDALYHGELKRQIRNQGFPKDNTELRNKCQIAVRNILNVRYNVVLCGHTLEI